MHILKRLSTVLSTFSLSRNLQKPFTMVERSVHATVGYVTDIEGNLNYWNNYIKISKVLERKDNAIVLNDYCQFVYGGDVCDRGAGDIRVLTDLVKLKSDYPDRVHFVMGNRDINKLRIPFSLHESTLHSRPRVYWIRKPAKEAFTGDIPLNDRSAKMKWMLGSTMGSPLAFEYRRQELKEMNQPHSDDDVTNSFEQLVHPVNGLLTQYLEAAKICVMIGDVAFVHGAFRDYNIGWVPDAALSRMTQTPEIDHTRMLPPNSSCGGVFLKDFKQWCECINAFAHNEIQAYKRDALKFLASMKSAHNSRSAMTEGHHGSGSESDNTKTVDEARLQGEIWEVFGGYSHATPGSRLVQYGMGWLRDRSVNPSVIYSSYLENGTPVECSSTVRNWLRHSGVNKIVVGHQPNGDAPFLMRYDGSDSHASVEAKADYFQVLSCDTSYSRNTQWPLEQLALSVAGKETTAVDPSPSTVISTQQQTQQQQQQPQQEGQQWMSNDQYMAVKAGAALSNPNDTRNGYTATEILFTFPLMNSNSNNNSTGNDISGAAATSSLVSASKITVCGTLSQQSFYAYHIHNNESEDMNDMARHIGRKTKEGWYVKACGVLLPQDAKAANIGLHSDMVVIDAHCSIHSKSAAGAAAVGSPKRYFVLSFSEGHTFKNKLVAETDIEQEF